MAKIFMEYHRGVHWWESDSEKCVSGVKKPIVKTQIKKSTLLESGKIEQWQSTKDLQCHVVYLRVNSRNRALQDDKQGSEPIRSAFKKGWSGTGGWMDYRLWTGPRRSRSSLEIKECLRQRRKQSWYRTYNPQYMTTGWVWLPWLGF